jgi:hypothetical protein
MIPGFLEFSGKNYSLTECADLKEGRESLSKFSAIMLDFLSSPKKFNCPVPCERNDYNYNFVHVHENADTTEDENEDEGVNFYNLYFYYSTFQVEEHVETLIYDDGGFLAASGGNLGLCLGFSCLSALLTLTQWTTMAYEWLKNRFTVYI